MKPKIQNQMMVLLCQLYAHFNYNYRNAGKFIKIDLFSGVIKDSELIAMQEKTNRHLRLRELLLENSMDANLVVM